MNNYRRIKFDGANRPLRPEDSARTHAASVAWLRNRLRSCDPGRTIVVTHAAPSARAAAPYHVNPKIAADHGNKDQRTKVMAFFGEKQSLTQLGRTPSMA